MARVHVYLHPDDYDTYRSGQEASGMLIHNTEQELVHLDVDDREITEYHYPMVSIRKVE